MADPKKHLHRYTEVFIKLDPYYAIIFRCRLPECGGISYALNISPDRPVKIPEIQANELLPEDLKFLKEFVTNIAALNKKNGH